MASVPPLIMFMRCTNFELQKLWVYRLLPPLGLSCQMGRQLNL